MLSRRGILGGLAAALVATTAHAALLRGKPVTANVSGIQFGLKTRSGYGGYFVNETPSGTITDLDTGLPTTEWVINSARELAPSGTYGAIKTYSKTAGQTYNLGLPSGAHATVTLVANAAHVQVNAADGGTTHQPRIYASAVVGASGALVLGDTVYFRDMAQFSPTTSQYTIQCPSAGYAGAGTITGGSGYTNGTYNNVILSDGTNARITIAGGVVTACHVNIPGSATVGNSISCANTNIGGTGSGWSLTVIDLHKKIVWRSDNVYDGSITNGYGNPRRGGGANLLSIGVSCVVADSGVPYTFQGFDFYFATSATHVIGVICGISAGNGVGGVYGVDVWDCMLGHPLSVGITFRTQTLLTYPKNCSILRNSFEATERGMQCNSGVTIKNNEFFLLSSDAIDLNQFDYVIEDNFAHDFYPQAGQHPDFVQHFGYTDGFSHNINTVCRHNVIWRNVGEVGQADCQGFFFADTTGAGRITGLTVEENIYLGTEVLGIHATRGGAPQINRNTALCDFNSVTNPGLFQVQINLLNGDNGQVTNCITNNLNCATQTGVTLTNNTQLARTLLAYNGIFAAYVDTPVVNVLQAKQAFAPILGKAVASGGAMNPDGTYQGGVFPKNTDNSVDWNDGSVYVPH